MQANLYTEIIDPAVRAW